MEGSGTRRALFRVDVQFRGGWRRGSFTQKSLRSAELAEKDFRRFALRLALAARALSSGAQPMAMTRLSVPVVSVSDKPAVICTGRSRAITNDKSANSQPAWGIRHAGHASFFQMDHRRRDHRHGRHRRSVADCRLLRICCRGLHQSHCRCLEHAVEPRCHQPVQHQQWRRWRWWLLSVGAPPEGSADCSGAGMLRLFGAQLGTGTDAGDARWSAGGLGRQ